MFWLPAWEIQAEKRCKWLTLMMISLLPKEEWEMFPKTTRQAITQKDK